MKSDSLQNYFLSKIQNNNHEGLKGTGITFHIPVKSSFLNYAAQTMLTGSDGVKDLHSVELSDFNHDEFLVQIDHKLIKKTVRCKFHEIEFNRYNEPELTIEFLEGIKFYEKAALNTVNKVQKGWKWMKSQFSGNNQKALEARKTPFKITGSKVVVYFSEMLRKQNLGYLNPLIRWDRFSTKNDSLILDFRIKIN